MAEQPAVDHPVDVVVVADVAAADGVVVVVAASSGHRPASVAAAAAVVAVDRAGASVDSCSATAGRTFPWPSFRSFAAAAGHRPSFAAACGVVAVPATAGQGASVAGCGGAEDAAVAFASWSETCTVRLRTVVGGNLPGSDPAGRASACGD